MQFHQPKPYPLLDPKNIAAESLALNISPFKDSSHNNLEIVAEDSPLKFSIPNSQDEDSSDFDLQGPYARNKKKFELLMTDVQRPADFNLRSMKSGASRFMPNQQQNVINLQQVEERNINDEEIV